MELEKGEWVVKLQKSVTCIYHEFDILFNIQTMGRSYDQDSIFTQK